MKKHIEQMDRETGEILQGCPAHLPYRPKLSERWFMAFQDMFERIAKDPDMTGESFRVLTYPHSKLDFENYIYQCQADIAAGLNMRSANVSRAMKMLTTKEIVLKGPHIKRLTHHQPNPNYTQKNKTKTPKNTHQKHPTTTTKKTKNHIILQQPTKNITNPKTYQINLQIYYNQFLTNFIHNFQKPNAPNPLTPNKINT